MKLFSWGIYHLVELAAYRGFAAGSQSGATDSRAARRMTGIRGETFAYWYLRRQGYTIIARNFKMSGIKGEIDLIGFDGKVLAFVEVKTRAGTSPVQALPEDAVNTEKRRHLSRMARQFLAERRISQAPCRFDVLAIEARPGHRPAVRLHKNAFAYR
jgi:putative endonuclease